MEVLGRDETLRRLSMAARTAGADGDGDGAA
jgi:hypothetical protein